MQRRPRGIAGHGTGARPRGFFPYCGEYLDAMTRDDRFADSVIEKRALLAREEGRGVILEPCLVGFGGEERRVAAQEATHRSMNTERRPSRERWFRLAFASIPIGIFASIEIMY